MAASGRFELPKEFVEQYSKKTPDFGFQGLGEFVFKRTYARKLNENDDIESWLQTVKRVVEGTMNMEMRHVRGNCDYWLEENNIERAQDFFDRLFSFKVIPGGRGLWAMGSPITEERNLYAALGNCGFVGTEGIGDNTYVLIPFLFLMDMSMCGVGMGFDTKGAGKRFVLETPIHDSILFVIPDTREGWIESLRLLLSHHFFEGAPRPIFDYHYIRKAGAPIKGFGGVSGGQKPLKAMHRLIKKVLKNHRGRYLGIRGIVDIMNIIGKCVVSGNVRRTAEIAFGPNTPEFLDLKNMKVNPDRKDYMWTSNNSVQAELDMNYEDIAERIRLNGEPGVIWLENIRNHGRIRDTEDFGNEDAFHPRKDSLVLGTNPCGEQPLENFELCSLVEVFPSRCTDLEDFKNTLAAAYFYVKTITLAEVHWPQSAEVMQRNRRIGVSLSGITQFLAAHTLDEFREWCEIGYALIRKLDREHSAYLKINQSIRVTTVKPSGTVSLLVGATPGMHYPIAPQYIRRVRLSPTSPFIGPLRDAGYTIGYSSAEKSAIAEFPVSSGCVGIRSEYEVGIFEQLDLAAFLQRHWSDNAVSVTVKFDPETEGHLIAPALERYQRLLKGVSFLPRMTGMYENMPYQAITVEEYQSLVASIRPISWSDNPSEPTQHSYCDNDGCSPIRPPDHERTRRRRKQHPPSPLKDE